MAEDYATWGQVVEVVLQGNKIAGNSTNPTYTLQAINFPPGMLNANGSNPALNGGGDLRAFLELEATNRLALDIKTFVVAVAEGDRECEVDITPPSVLLGTNKSIWFRYDKAGVSQPADDEPFGSHAARHSSQKFHLPLKESSGDPTPQFKDRSSNNNDATAIDSPATVDVQVGKGLELGGFPERLEILSSSDFDLDTSESWWIAFIIDKLTDNTYNTVMHRAATSSPFAGWVIEAGSPTRETVFSLLNNATGAEGIKSSTSIPSGGTKTFVVLVHDKDNDLLILYFNAQNDAQEVASTSMPWGNSPTVLTIGNQPGAGDRDLNAKIDHITFAKGAKLTAGEVETMQNNLFLAPEFAIPGEPEAPDSIPPTVSNRNPDNLDVGVAIDTTVYFELDDNVSGVDSTTITVTIEGVNAVLNGAAQPGFGATIVSDGGLGFNVTITPDDLFSLSQVIDVTVNADDLNANSMDQDEYSFTIIGPDTSPPFGGIVSLPINRGVTSDLVTLKTTGWTEPGNHSLPLQYQFAVSKDPKFAQDVITYPFQLSDELQVLLEPNVQYYARIRAADSAVI